MCNWVALINIPLSDFNPLPLAGWVLIWVVVSNIFWFHPQPGEMIQFDEYVSNGSVQPPPSDPFHCLDMRFPPNTCRHGKMIDFQCLGSGAKWSGVGVPLDFSVNFTVVWGGVIPKKNIEFYSKGNPSLRMTQQFLEFPRLLKHHQIHPQQLLGFLSISACPFRKRLAMAMPRGHVSYRFPVLRRAKRKKADKTGKKSQIRLCTLDRGPLHSVPPPSSYICWICHKSSWEKWDIPAGFIEIWYDSSSHNSDMFCLRMFKASFSGFDPIVFITIFVATIW